MNSNLQLQKLRCEVIGGRTEPENIPVYGLRCVFSDGTQRSYPDISTEREDAERLARLLDGADVEPFQLEEIVEDFVDELYMPKV